MFRGMSKLASLDLSGNTYTTTVPPEMASLPSLQALAFTNSTFLVQQDFSFLAQMASLGAFWMDGAVTPSYRPLPTDIGLWSPSLHVLSLSRSMISGTIPTEVGNLSSLGFLSLRGNNMTGPIPSEVGRLSGLWSLYLHDNDLLTGTVPQDVCRLSLNGSLTYFSTGCSVLCGCCTCCGPPCAVFALFP